VPEAEDFADLILLYQHIRPPRHTEACLDYEREDAMTFCEGMFHGSERRRELNTRHVD